MKALLPCAVQGMARIQPTPSRQGLAEGRASKYTMQKRAIGKRRPGASRVQGEFAAGARNRGRQLRCRRVADPDLAAKLQSELPQGRRVRTCNLELEKLQPPGASAEGWVEPALHSIKNGRRPLASSLRLSVDHCSKRPSGRFRDPGVGPSKAILSRLRRAANSARAPGCAAQPTSRGSVSFPRP